MFAYHYPIMALHFQSKKFLKSRILQQYLVDWNGIIINKNKLPESFITPGAYKFTYRGASCLKPLPHPNCSPSLTFVYKGSSVR